MVSIFSYFFYIWPWLFVWARGVVAVSALPRCLGLLLAVGPGACLALGSPLGGVGGPSDTSTK